VHDVERFLARIARDAGRRAPLSVFCLLAAAAQAADVGLAGVFPGKALLTINGGAPRIVAVGSTTAEGVAVLAVDGETATIESDGRKRRLRVGENVASPAAPTGGARATLMADAQGHFLTTGSINGTTVRFMVDTGATMIGLGAGDARRIGIDTSKGVPDFSMTANGPARVVRVKLDSVRVGEITVNNVDALVHEHDLPLALLGMSFLNRMEMQRDGQSMTLRKRF
jgi:aspartyl protease family protein